MQTNLKFFVFVFMLVVLFSQCGNRGFKESAQYELSDNRGYAKREKGDEQTVEEFAPKDGIATDSVNPKHNTEAYDKIVENPFLRTLENPVSTFAVDVDKASYSNCRRYLNGNQLPPTDAVRIEEFINYFDYTYPQPTEEHPFATIIEKSKCPWNEKHDLLLIGLKGKETALSSIPPANLVFLLDVSGSMESPEKLPLLKMSLKLLLEKLRPTDKVAIVVYAGAAGVVLPSTEVREKEKIMNAFEKLKAGGSTAGGEGIIKAYQIAQENFIKDGFNRVILATDGDFNIGASSDSEMERLIEEKRKTGIFITVLGFGMGNYKDSKMEKIADAGNGNYAYIDNILEAKKVLNTEMWRTLYAIAKDVKIQIEFNPAKVKGYRLIGYENRMLRREDFNDDKKDAGEIGAGHTVTALYEIIPAESTEEIPGSDNLEYQNTKVVKSDNVMTLKLRYKKPDQETSILMEKRLKDADMQVSTTSNNFNWAATVAGFAMLLRKSEFKGSTTYSTLLEKAKLHKGTDVDGYRTEMITLIEKAEALDK